MAFRFTWPGAKGGADASGPPSQGKAGAIPTSERRDALAPTSHGRDLATPASQRKDGAPPTSARTTSTDASWSHEDADGAIDTVGSMLRSLGTDAVGVDDLDGKAVHQQFEAWAQHVLVGAPPPSSRGRDASGRLRDWAAVRQFVAGHRKRELSFVAKSLVDMRQVIWSFVAGVNRVAAHETRDGALAREQLARLRTALDGNDTETLKREAAAAVTSIGSVFEQQSKRRVAELAEFATHVKALGEQLEDAKREGTIDPLTRVHNRACLDDYLAHTAELSSLFGQPVCVLMVDIDRFKPINDTLGHQAGDAVIKAIASCLLRTFPRRGDLVARYGGDEFAIVLRDTPIADGRMLAQRLVEAVRSEAVVLQQRDVHVTASVGLAAGRPDDTAQTWMARADAALYLAKQQGRDRWAEALAPAST